MPGNEEIIIEAKGLTKRFAEVQAVSGVDFTVSRGELFGFLGPNGAGKTTTINMLTGLARPDAGMIRVGGLDCTSNPKAAQRLMGVVPDESNLYPELSGFDNLCFCGALYGMTKGDRQERAQKLLAQFGLTDAATRGFGGYSKGMKRKLTLAAGIMHEPQILFLDEPTTGIDVASARQIRQLIASLNQSGTTIFLTTHYIEEAERLCGRIAFIVKGRVVRLDTVESLMQETEGRHLVQFSVSGRAADLCEAVGGVFPRLRCAPVSDQELLVESSEPVRIGPLVRLIEEERGVEVTEARKIRPSLEEVFVRITGIEVTAVETEKEKKTAGGGA